MYIVSHSHKIMRIVSLSGKSRPSLVLESGTISRRTSDSRTGHVAVSNNRWRHFYSVSGTKSQCDSPSTALWKFSYLLTYWCHPANSRNTVSA